MAGLVHTAGEGFRSVVRDARWVLCAAQLHGTVSGREALGARIGINPRLQVLRTPGCNGQGTGRSTTPQPAEDVSTCTVTMSIPW